MLRGTLAQHYLAYILLNSVCYIHAHIRTCVSFELPSSVLNSCFFVQPSRSILEPEVIFKKKWNATKPKKSVPPFAPSKSKALLIFFALCSELSPVDEGNSYVSVMITSPCSWKGYLLAEECPSVSISILVCLLFQKSAEEPGIQKLRLIVLNTW